MMDRIIDITRNGVQPGFPPRGAHRQEGAASSPVAPSAPINLLTGYRAGGYADTDILRQRREGR